MFYFGTKEVLSDKRQELPRLFGMGLVENATVLLLHGVQHGSRLEVSHQQNETCRGERTQNFVDTLERDITLTEQLDAVDHKLRLTNDPVRVTR